jgi:hypothetical protein
VNAANCSEQVVAVTPSEGIPLCVVAAVDTLTRINGEHYHQFIGRVSEMRWQLQLKLMTWRMLWISCASIALAKRIWSAWPGNIVPGYD